MTHGSERLYRPEYENPVIAELERALRQAALLPWPRRWVVALRVRRAKREVEER